MDKDLFIGDAETGELLVEGNSNAVKGYLKDEEKRQQEAIIGKIKNDELDDITYEDMVKLLNGKSTVYLDFSGDGYTITPNNKYAHQISDITAGMIYKLSNGYISWEARLVYGNGRPITKYSQIREILNMNTHNWYKYVKPDIDKYNIITREEIRDNVYFIVNPMFMFKSRMITETIFLAFHEELEEVISKFEYLLLCKKFNITPLKG